MDEQEEAHILVEQNKHLILTATSFGVSMYLVTTALGLTRHLYAPHDTTYIPFKVFPGLLILSTSTIYSFLNLITYYLEDVSEGACTGIRVIEVVMRVFGEMAWMAAIYLVTEFFLSPILENGDPRNVTDGVDMEEDPQAGVDARMREMLGLMPEMPPGTERLPESKAVFRKKAIYGIMLVLLAARMAIIATPYFLHSQPDLSSTVELAVLPRCTIRASHPGTILDYLFIATSFISFGFLTFVLGVVWKHSRVHWWRNQPFFVWLLSSQSRQAWLGQINRTEEDVAGMDSEQRSRLLKHDVDGWLHIWLRIQKGIWAVLFGDATTEQMTDQERKRRISRVRKERQKWWEREMKTRKWHVVWRRGGVGWLLSYSTLNLAFHLVALIYPQVAKNVYARTSLDTMNSLLACLWVNDVRLVVRPPAWWEQWMVVLEEWWLEQDCLQREKHRQDRHRMEWGFD